jgi:Icc protein
VAGGGPTVIAQLTDPHIVAAGERLGDQIDTAGHLRDAVEHVNGLDLQPDLVVLTGDLTDAGCRAEYDNLASLLAPLRAPVVLLPGNHDVPETLAEVFPAEREWPRALDVGPLRLLLLDDSVPGSPNGRVGPEQLAWLDRTLGESSAPTIVAVHHPPYATGITHMDEMGLDDGDALGDVIERHRHVVRVITGHLHRNITTLWRGTVVTTSQSTAHQVALDLGDGPARWRREPPAAQLHVWLPDEGLLVTHMSPIGDFGPPEPF